MPEHANRSQTPPPPNWGDCETVFWLRTLPRIVSSIGCLPYGRGNQGPFVGLPLIFRGTMRLGKMPGFDDSKGQQPPNRS